MPRSKLSKLTIKGFKSIAELEDFQPRSLNVLIGPNGAGKSNFIGFFRFLKGMLGGTTGGLQTQVEMLGGANAILHDGAAVTRELVADLEIETGARWNEYTFHLAFSGGDRFIFTDEKMGFQEGEIRHNWHLHASGHQETKILEAFDEPENEIAETIISLLRRIMVYQFHNTSVTSRIRTRWSVEDGRYLKEDGGNLGAFLFNMRAYRSPHYQRIVRYLQTLLPFFDDFVLENEYGKILLRWREKGCDMEFDSSSASDGMLRIMSLVALLCQPPEHLPDVMFFDEPELGLHPAAINLVAGLIKSVSQHVQVFIATQSIELLNQFEPEDVVVVDRIGRKSTFTRLDAASLGQWLEEYSLGELWDKNVIGGKP